MMTDEEIQEVRTRQEERRKWGSCDYCLEDVDRLLDEIDRLKLEMDWLQAELENYRSKYEYGEEAEC